MNSVPSGASAASGAAGSAWTKPERLWPAAIAIAVLSGTVAGAAQLGTVAMLIVVALVQGAMLISWLAVANPPSPRGVSAIAVTSALGADVLAAFGTRDSLTSLAAVVAFAVLATIVVQLARGVARARVTEAMAASLGTALGAVSVATLLVLLRQGGGTEAVTATVLALAVALFTARCVDRVLPRPHVARGIERGGLGIFLGTLAGATITACYAATVVALTAQSAALLGAAVSLVAVLSDLAASYALVTAPHRPAYTFAAGPLVALAAATPVAYLLGLLVVP